MALRLPGIWQMLIVCHFEREDGEIIRIISARLATMHESAFIEASDMKDEYDRVGFPSRRCAGP